MTKHSKREREQAILDRICREHTAFQSFAQLVAARGYRPSIDMREPWGPRLADAYDAAMSVREDTRRAYRYGGKPAAPTRTERMAQSYRITYNGFTIAVKRDFGDQPFLIDGLPCAWGYVVCYGEGHQYEGCNAMPGATWFQTVKEAKRAIDMLIAVGGEGNSTQFWKALREVGRMTQAEWQAAIEKAAYTGLRYGLNRPVTGLEREEIVAEMLYAVMPDRVPLDIVRVHEDRELVAPIANAVLAEGGK